MLPNLKTYTCADCKITGEFTGYRQARAAGWSISKDYTICRCPNCAPAYRFGKAAEKNYVTVSELPDGWEQLKII